MRSYLLGLVNNCDADYVEIRLEERTQTNIQYLGCSVENIGELMIYGGNVRALVNGGWGFVSFNRIDELEAKVEQAIMMARMIGKASGDNFSLASVPVVNDEVIPVLGTDPRKVPLSRKKAVTDEYNQIILGKHPDVRTSTIRYLDQYTTLTFVNSQGTYVKQERSDIGLSLAAIATRGGVTQSGRFSTGGSSGFDVVLGHKQKAEEIVDRAVELLDARPVVGGVYTVICDPDLAGIFAHEAFGHLSEADDMMENPSKMEVMKLGRRFGQDELTIYDSGVVDGVRGYMKYDDEGVPAGRTDLIRNGLLVGRLHSRESAGRMGEKATGNARAIDYRFPPICRMRTTAIEEGHASFEDMIADIKLGVYAVSTYGGQTNGEMFTFTAGEGYMIRDGKVEELVRDVMLTGNVFTTLTNIDMVGNDFRIFDSTGGCGKGEQSSLATSKGSPHIRIQGVVVGGGKDGA